jgi:hypothetical protein
MRSCVELTSTCEAQYLPRSSLRLHADAGRTRAVVLANGLSGTCCVQSFTLVDGQATASPPEQVGLFVISRRDAGMSTFWPETQAYRSRKPTTPHTHT